VVESKAAMLYVVWKVPLLSMEFVEPSGSLGVVSKMATSLIVLEVPLSVGYVVPIGTEVAMPAKTVASVWLSLPDLKIHENSIFCFAFRIFLIDTTIYILVVLEHLSRYHKSLPMILEHKLILDFSLHLPPWKTKADNIA
jgi:hypothetical protein